LAHPVVTNVTVRAVEVMLEAGLFVRSTAGVFNLQQLLADLNNPLRWSVVNGGMSPNAVFTIAAAMRMR